MNPFQKILIQEAFHRGIQLDFDLAVDQHATDRLQAKINRMNNPTVMGLDPMLDYLPHELIEQANRLFADQDEAHAFALARFNFDLIDAVCDVIPAIKPQYAYYEQYGPAALETLNATIQYAKQKGMIAIADAKRNDIGSTAACYARSIIAEHGGDYVSYEADWITLNGYLGIDGVQPFIDVCQEHNCGMFVLVRTSNPSAGDLQDLELADGRKVYEAMADLVSSWGESSIGKSGFSTVGAVVGATWPEQAIALRQRMPHTFFLIPGYGAQGGKADDAVAGFNEKGEGAIVNASRSLMCAYRQHKYPKSDFAQACRIEAYQMKKELNAALDRKLNA